MTATIVQIFISNIIERRITTSSYVLIEYSKLFLHNMNIWIMHGK